MEHVQFVSLVLDSTSMRTLAPRPPFKLCIQLLNTQTSVLRSIRPVVDPFSINVLFQPYQGWGPVFVEPSIEGSKNALREEASGRIKHKFFALHYCLYASGTALASRADGVRPWGWGSLSRRSV